MTPEMFAWLGLALYAAVGALALWAWWALFSGNADRIMLVCRRLYGNDIEGEYDRIVREGGRR